MGGRFYNVQRDPEEAARSAGCAAMILLALAIVLGIAVYVPYAANQEEIKSVQVKRRLNTCSACMGRTAKSGDGQKNCCGKQRLITGLKPIAIPM